MKALILEDDILKINLLKALLKDYFESIIIADSISAAFRIMELEAFNFYFIDQTLPDGKGEQILSFLQKNNREAKFISISNDYNIEENHKKLGFHDFFSAPYLPKLHRIFKTKNKYYPL